MEAISAMTSNVKFYNLVLSQKSERKFRSHNSVWTYLLTGTERTGKKTLQTNRIVS
jgi:hypothetical protein